MVVVAAAKILRLTLVGVGVPGITFPGLGGFFRIAFGGVIFGMGLLRAHLADLLFVIVLMLVLVFVGVSLLVLVFIVVLRSVCWPCWPGSKRKRRIRTRISRINLEIKGVWVSESDKGVGFATEGGFAAARFRYKR